VSVIHVATAHHHSHEWIELQRRFLDRHLSEPYRFYGSLEGVPEEYGRFFDVVVPSMGDHAGKLNLMGHVILQEAEPDDLIVFLDGDAFPVADVLGPVRARLETSALVAVQRLENHGDSQPHPCFCVVPVRVWRDLPGDWTSGHCFRPNRTDVGGNLQWLLDARHLSWSPLLRTHSLAPHDLLFAVYGGIIYHHGAGFRGLKPPGQGSETWSPRIPDSASRVARMEQMRERHPERFEKFLAAAMETAVLSQRVYDEILADADIFEDLLATS
jgi:hypothetical protein